MTSHTSKSPVYNSELRNKTFLVSKEDIINHGHATIQYDGKPVQLSIGESFQRTITIVESELLESESDDESDRLSTATTLSLGHSYSPTIRESFDDSQSQWVDDPIIARWRAPDHRAHEVIQSLETLHHEWRHTTVGPFSAISDPLWLQTGQVLADIGLPWHNNQINMPDEIDTSWPFHFKSFETQVIRAKGERVGDPRPSGYVCNWGEANCYGIRALQQELRETHPRERPLLAYDNIDEEIVKSAEKLFGLDLHRVDLSGSIVSAQADLMYRTDGGLRPIIFAATCANSNGGYDDLSSICELSESLPIILHVDASRSFDYITTLNSEQRQKLGIQKLSLGINRLDNSLRSTDGSIIAGSIIAGGSNYTCPAPVVALKPSALGSIHTKVAYTRASDSTLAGSRDALAPLWVALHEIRYGAVGFRNIYQHCADMREALTEALEAQGVVFSAPTYTLDVILQNCSAIQTHRLAEYGGIPTPDGCVMLTIQPSVTLKGIGAVVEILSPSYNGDFQCMAFGKQPQDFAHTYPVPQNIIEDLTRTVQAWRVATRSAAGYPFHMGSYSALGPLIGHFLDVKIPDTWIKTKTTEVIDQRLRSFGLDHPEEISCFKGAFTNGSTMGNRVGIHTALTHFPGAFLYFSSETHYSVPKTARDCDTLTNRWSGRSCRYSEIPCDSDGSVCIEKLVQQAVIDREDCQLHGEEFQLILFLNMGTTFVGARDNLEEIHTKLREVDINISYIHMDGALDFGFHDCGIALGPPGLVEKNGVPVVQGVTLSHHKAMGNMVSGEVLCYSPGAQLATLGSGVDPRAIFETWLYLQMYSEADLKEMFEYCRVNATRLEAGLKEIRTTTKRNKDSTIVVLERPPAWITEEFSLRPQEDWVHFITMPHISQDTVDLFVDRISWTDRQCERAFSYIKPQLTATMKQPLKLKRIQCRSALAEKVTTLAQALVQPVEWHYGSVHSAIKASLRGAMTMVAVDEHDEPQVVFLAESTRDRKLRAGPVLVRTSDMDHSKRKKMVTDVARQLVGFVARHLDVQVETDDMSYAFLPLAQKSWTSNLVLV